MIVYDNIIFSLQRAGGISVVWSSLVERVLKMTDDLAFLEYENAKENIFRQSLDIPIQKLRISKKFSKIFSQLMNPTVGYGQPFIFHSSYFRTCSNPNAINVTTVHDFIYEQGKPNLKQKLRIWLNYNALKRSDAIVCISENTKKDLLRFLPEVAGKDIRVIYNGVSEEYNSLDNIPYPQYKDTILYVGGRQSYKNFEFLVKGIKDTKYSLLICGSDLSEAETRLLDLNLPGRYEVVLYPSNDELNRIYNSVYCLAYPSSYEGFGIPVLEAQRAGCPVIALSASSIPEIIGENALMMSKLDSDEMINLLDKLQSPQCREDVIKAGLKNVERFSWEKMANDYMELYESLLKSR